MLSVGPILALLLVEYMTVHFSKNNYTLDEICGMILQEFDKEPHWSLLKELLIQVCNDLYRMIGIHSTGTIKLSLC